MGRGDVAVGREGRGGSGGRDKRGSEGDERGGGWSAGP